MALAQQGGASKKAIILYILLGIFVGFVLCISFAFIISGAEENKREASITKDFKPTETKKLNETDIYLLTNPPPTRTLTTVPTTTEVPSATPEPTLSPLFSTLSTFVSYYDNLTDLQRQDFLAYIPGHKVAWSGTVIDVNSDGTIIASIPGSWWNSIHLEGLSVEQAKKINKGQKIHYKGVIRKVDDVLGLTLYVEISEIY